MSTWQMATAAGTLQMCTFLFGVSQCKTGVILSGMAADILRALGHFMICSAEEAVRLRPAGHIALSDYDQTAFRTVAANCQVPATCHFPCVKSAYDRRSPLYCG
ncbi:hypothetical protein FB451DRAFT_1163764 [Mycena latifolia]|nr:hypothetical protein FB451DRAFT_1163764 [Mycena latifolia]